MKCMKPKSAIAQLTSAPHVLCAKKTCLHWNKYTEIRSSSCSHKHVFESMQRFHHRIYQIHHHVVLPTMTAWLSGWLASFHGFNIKGLDCIKCNTSRANKNGKNIHRYCRNSANTDDSWRAGRSSISCVLQLLSHACAVSFTKYFN